MFEQRGHTALIVGAVVAFLLQIIIAPCIVIGNAMPNFVAAYCIAYAIAAPRRTSPLIMAFVCGLLYNLLCGGVMGSAALALTLVSYIAMGLYETLDSENVPTAIAGVCVALLAVELLYALCALLFGGSGAGIVDALVFRALPCTLYDCVAGIAAYFVVARFARSESVQVNISSVRLR